MDALKNFAISLVATAPSPATSGTSLVVTAGQGAYFPATPFDATIWPSGVQPTNTNAEIVRVTNVSTDTFTITRAQYGTTAQSIAVGYQIAQTVDANLLNQLAPLSGATFTGEVVAPDFKASGLTGATAASRYVGATTNGAPTSGTFAVGDFIVDQTSTFWVCTTAGTPGTWWPLIEAHMVSRSATATAGPNEVTIFSGSTVSQTISVIALPVDGATWTIINRSSVPVTAGFGASSMLPLGSTSSVTSLVVPVNGAYSFINYAAGQWYMTASNNLANSVGTLSVTNGGTGTATAPAVGSIPVGSSTSAYTPLAIGTAGQVLQSNGTTATWSSSTALATVSLTAQSAAQAATTLYTPASDGLFTINYYAKVTTAATTSSTLGVFSVISTDTDSNVITSVGQSTQQNSLTTGFISGSITVYAKASTPIQYSLAYASSGATAMQYELRVVVAGTTAPSSTGTVSSFNGRTGAVTPGSSDYTAAQVGALATTQNVAGKNFIINGGMDIWQRGTTSTAAGYQTADRWWFNASASTTQQQSTSTVPPGSQYSFQMTVGGSAASINLRQVVETKNTLPLAGQTVTFSGLVQASASVGMTFTLYYSTVVDDNVSSGAWSGVSGTGGTGTAVSGSWTNITGTFSVPSTAKSLLIYVANTSGTVASGVSVYLGQLQLEIGSTATAFSRAGGTIQGELAACQRYFWNQTSVGANSAYASFGVGQCYSSTNALINVSFPVTMRANPSITPSSPLSGMSMSTALLGGASVTSISNNAITPYGTQLVVAASGGGLVGGNATQVGAAGNNTAYIQYSAEL